MYPESIPGERYLIDAECYNGGFPYSDNFRTVIRYCLTRAGPASTRVIISGRVVYVKSVMGLIRGESLGVTITLHYIMLLPNTIRKRENENENCNSIVKMFTPCRIYNSRTCFWLVRIASSFNVPPMGQVTWCHHEGDGERVACFLGNRVNSSGVNRQRRVLVMNSASLSISDVVFTEHIIIYKLTCVRPSSLVLIVIQ